VGGLEPLVTLLGTLSEVALVIALFFATFTAFALAILATAILAMAIAVVALSNGVGPFGPAFAGEVMQLASVALFKLAAHFAFRDRSYFLKLMAEIGAVVHLSIVDRFEILSKSLKGLFAKFPSRANAFNSVGLVECHVEPPHLKFCTGRDDIARG
jgi:hypothetical protein